MRALIEEKFKQRFNSNPILVRSPGRINLIGEHTDYNDGFVFPAAIDKEIHFAVALNTVNKFRFYAVDLDEHFEIALDKIAKTPTLWANYLLGVAAQFIAGGFSITAGVDCVFGGNIPLGAGLSSSAALENGFAFALNHLFGLKIEKQKLIRMAQKAEHEYAGVNCGIMDQFASMFGKQDQAMMLDCRSMEFEYAPIQLNEHTIVLIDTKVSHSLASSAYNTRRAECEEGVKVFQKQYPQVQSLRDVNIAMLNQCRAELRDVVYTRCKFVISECNRVQQAKKALSEGNIQQVGELLYQSHDGLSNNYEVSCPELDLLVDIAKNSGMVIGSRMMGGGFGGCTINLVKKTHETEFKQHILDAYKKQTGLIAQAYSVHIVDGTGLIA